MAQVASGGISRRPTVPDRCRRTPDCSYDNTFGLFLCNVRGSPCSYRGPVYVLTGETRQYECRKVGTSDDGQITSA